jgi:hypothetical protein
MATIKEDEKIDDLRTVLMLQGHIATLELTRPNWKDERMIKYDEMIARMENTLLFLREFEDK